MTPSDGLHAPEDPLAGARVAIAAREPAALADVLSRAGAIVSVLDDAAQALLGALDGSFGAVIASLHGSGLEGELLARVLRDRGDLRVAVVLLGDDQEGEAAIIRGLEAGADDCLLAPVRPEVLRTKLRVILRTRLEETKPLLLPTVFDDAIAADPVAPCRFDGHQLLRLIGSGSFGKVFEARALADGSRVALKLVCPDVSEDQALLTRFLREVAALQRVRSPRVVRVHGAGYHRGRFFLVMDFLDGTPASCLPGRARLDVGLVVKLGLDICTALEAVAAAGLVHRDIKPANVIVGEDGHATLLDFGLAKPIRCKVEVTGRTELLGTLPYLAPEVVEGAPQDMGSDLYALGVTLWELLGARLPYHAKTELQLLELIARGPRAPEVREVRPDVPPQLSWLIARLMERDPSVRLGDPAAVRRGLLSLNPVAAPGW